MEITKDHSNEEKQRLLFRACFSKGVSYHHTFGRDSKAGTESESFRVSEREASSMPQIGDFLHGELKED